MTIIGRCIKLLIIGIAVSFAIMCLVLRFKHPEKTETQLFLDLMKMKF